MINNFWTNRNAEEELILVKLAQRFAGFVAWKTGGRVPTTQEAEDWAVEFVETWVEACGQDKA